MRLCGNFIKKLTKFAIRPMRVDSLNQESVQSFVSIQRPSAEPEQGLDEIRPGDPALLATNVINLYHIYSS